VKVTTGGKFAPGVELLRSSVLLHRSGAAAQLCESQGAKVTRGQGHQGSRSPGVMVTRGGKFAPGVELLRSSVSPAFGPVLPPSVARNSAILRPATKSHKSKSAQNQISSQDQVSEPENSAQGKS